jgi:inosose dehydratase
VTIAIANAPVSYGAFELTVGIMPGVPDGETVLADVADAGYAGIDLGPLGYLGDADDIRSNLSGHRLALSGGFVELPFEDPDRMPGALQSLSAVLDVFDGARGGDGPAPKPTLAAMTRDASVSFDDERWRRFGEGVEMALAVCRERGYEATFHHETGTYVQTPREIEKVLERTTIGLCLDTGHLLLGGGDPLTAIREWRPRINHLHLKDAHRSVIEAIVREGAPPSEIWRRGAFCPLGDGDLDVEAFLEEIRGGYDGWLVVEQDTLPDPSGRPAADQRANREYLAARGF